MKSQEQVERNRRNCKKYRERHADKIREYMRKWYAEHPGYSKKKYNALSPEQKKEYRERMKEKYKGPWGNIHRATAKRSRMKVKMEVIAAYGGECQCCGEKTLEFLTIDHIFGSGRKEVMALNIGRGFQYYGYLRRNNFPDKDRLRVLCMNCNFAIGLMGGHCPHERQRFVPDTLGDPLSSMSGATSLVN